MAWHRPWQDIETHNFRQRKVQLGATWNNKHRCVISCMFCIWSTISGTTLSPIVDDVPCPCVLSRGGKKAFMSVGVQFCSCVCFARYCSSVDCVWNVMAHAQKPDFVFRAKRTSPFKSAGTSVQSTTGGRGVRISGSNAGYTMFRGSVKGTGYPFHSPVSPSLPLPCVTVCHHISCGPYQPYRRRTGVNPSMCMQIIFENSVPSFAWGKSFRVCSSHHVLAYVISGFRCGVCQICALLGCYSA